MSIWNDVLLHDYCANRNLVQPFDPANVNPASIDLRLGTSYRRDTDDGWGEELQMPPEGIWLQPGEFVLCCSMETVQIPLDAVAHLYSKSSTGRMGIEHLHCIAGDTMIDVPRDVSKRPKGVSVSELADMQSPFDIYAFDTAAMVFVLTKGMAFKAKAQTKVVRVSYEWVTGRKRKRDSIVCTPDHRFLTLGGEWVEAKDLAGVRLRPFPRSIDQRYPTIGPNPLSQTMIREHRFIAESLHALPSGKWEVHHQDGNRLNNQPDNLVIVRPGEHQQMHSAGKNNPFYGKQHTEETRNRLGAMRTGRHLSGQHRQKIAEAHLGEKNPSYLDISIGQITTAYNQAGTIEGAAVLLGVSPDTLVRKIRNNGYSGTVEFRRAIVAQTNHKVYEVVELPELIDTYDIHVPGYENFVANGVVIHNSGLGDPGFCGQWTFELHNVARSPRLLVPGKRYMQMEIVEMVAPALRDYSQTGRYQGQQGATPAREAR